MNFEYFWEKIGNFRSKDGRARDQILGLFASGVQGLSPIARSVP